MVAASTLITFIMPENYSTTMHVFVLPGGELVTRAPGLPAPVGTCIYL